MDRNIITLKSIPSALLEFPFVVLCFSISHLHLSFRFSQYQHKDTITIVRPITHKAYRQINKSLNPHRTLNTQWTKKASYNIVRLIFGIEITTIFDYLLWLAATENLYKLKIWDRPLMQQPITKRRYVFFRTRKMSSLQNGKKALVRMKLQFFRQC